ncbi:MAG: helix-turn-helix transcriptional regulator [Clostridia bacterium]|nr:helix-turn-helix transcriptional regulator [Clostridia bacterium]
MILNSISVSPVFTIRQFHTAFRYEWDNGFSYMGESHDFWEAVYVKAGEVQVTEGANIYSLKEGELILHAPMEFHNIRSEEGASSRVLILSFSTEGELPDKLTRGVFRLSETEREDYEGVFELVYRLFQRRDEDPYAGTECAGRLTAFLIGVGRGGEAERPLVRSRSAQEYRRVVNAMTARVYENIALEDIAAAENISVSYLKLLFKMYSGTSPKLYWSRLRCNEAVKLLQQGVSPTEIADRMNFSSPNYFSTFFKRMTGISPRDYPQNA